MVDGVGHDVASLLGHAISRRLELLGFLITLFNLLVVLEVGEELAPCNKLLMVDCVILFRQLHHLIHLIALDLIENLVKFEHLRFLASNAHSFCINEVDHFHVHSKVLNILSSLKNAVTIFVKPFKLLFHGLDLRRQQEAL